MRGVVSLATALALPRFLAGGAPFPHRTEIIMVTMCVIVLTLLLQGLSLAPIIRAFNFAPELGHHAEERLAHKPPLDIHFACKRDSTPLDETVKPGVRPSSHTSWLIPNVTPRARSVRYEKQARRRGPP